MQDHVHAPRTPGPDTSLLLVDDDDDLRETLVEQLGFYDEFSILQEANATKAVNTAKATQVDLLIMDVGLPDMDGRESVKVLRKNGFKAPIIMLTGHDTDSDTILGLEAGANDYVTKPFRFAVLLARIRAQLRQYEQSEDATFTVGGVPSPDATLAVRTVRLPPSGIASRALTARLTTTCSNCDRSALTGQRSRPCTTWPLMMTKRLGGSGE